MTEKDKDELQRALMAAWDIRDELLELTKSSHGRLVDPIRLEVVQNKMGHLVIELGRLSSDTINSIIKLEAEVQSLQEKVEFMGHDQSNLEDEVAALQTEVEELKVSED